jgi:hypothetical protein
MVVAGRMVADNWTAAYPWIAADLRFHTLEMYNVRSKERATVVPPFSVARAAPPLAPPGPSAVPGSP